MSNQRVTVASFDNRVAAEVARARLHALGIQSWIETDDAGGVLPPLQSLGVRLMVDAGEVVRASEALSRKESDDDSVVSESPFEPPVRRESRSRLGSILLVFLGVVGGFCLDEFDVVGSGRHPHAGETDEDQNGDGRVDTWFEYVDGAPVRGRYDRNADGSPDYWEFYSGGVVATTEADDDFDGAPDSWSRYSHSFPSEVEQDSDFNGTPDLFTSFQYGIPVSTLLRPDRGRPEREYRYVHGVNREIFEIDPDGNRRLIRVFDELGRELPLPR